MSIKGAIPFAEAPVVPQKVGTYEIVKELGRGESATIYLGRELFPAREVAIKMYDERNMSAESRKVFHSLFLKETLLSRRLKHPNITQVYDAATDDQRTYIVMEYAKEGNLDRFCTRDTLLPPERVAHLLERCCDALSYANANGVIHRDLKPANILMGADGEAKVADFGVAFSNLSFDTTRSMVVGSPAYMAPEQLEGKPASMKSDMYSMGIVLYKMLTASLPFTASTHLELAKRIVAGGLPPPGAARAGVPPQLDAVFAKATARDPEARYATWEDFAAELRAVAQPGGVDTNVNERATQLRALPFFKTFDAASLADAAAMGRWFELRSGMALVGEGDPGYSFFVVVRGQVRITRKGTLLAIRGSGECIAESSFLLKSAARRFSSVEAVTDCTVVEFSPDVLWLATPECKRRFDEAFLATLAERLVAAEGALAEMLAAKSVTLF
ncbi:MAG TPA: serine/threonine-protein kinase [Usitatibacter sp.]|nr:serine/threonine-protein kinase [Usitatibacter sp.]